MFSIVTKGDTANFTSTDGVIVDGLDAAVWRIEVDDNGAYKGLKKNQPIYPRMGKIYGTKLKKRVNKVVKTFKQPNTKNLGVLVYGNKGMGKTSLSDELSNTFIEDLSIPILEVKNMIRASDMEKIIKAFSPCVIYVDEYSKYYSPAGRNTTGGDSNKDYRDELLQLMSDETLGKVLWLLCDNEIRNISEYMVHRSGRIKYSFKYTYVEEDVVRDICKDYKVNDEITSFIVDHAKHSQENIDNIITLAKHSEGYTSLKKFIEEEVQDLNVKPPRFVRYSIKTDKPDKLKATIVDDKIKFSVTQEKQVVGEDGEVLADEGVNETLFNIRDIDNWRNRKGTVFGVSYSLEKKYEEEKPDDTYEAAVSAAPASTFSSSFMF